MTKTDIDQIVSEQVERFKQYLVARRRSPGTITQYTRAVTSFLRLCDKSPEQITAEDGEKYLQYLAANMSENTQCGKVVAVNRYFEKILKKPDLKMDVPRTVQVERIPLLKSEVMAIREAAAGMRYGKRNKAIIDMMYYGCLRVSEVANLTLSCLDLENNRLRVNAGKGKNYDMVQLTPEAVQSLRDYIDNERTAPEEGSEDVLFLSNQNEVLTAVQLTKIVEGAAELSGIKRRKEVHPHLFRHSGLSHMSESGASMETVRKQARHRSLATTGRYVHHTEKAYKDDYEKAFGVKPAESTSPIPAQSATLVSKGSEQVAYGKLTHEDILRARLEGKIDTDTMESMLARLDGEAIPQRIPKARETVNYYG